MNLTQVQIDTWWYVSVALVVIGATILHVGLGLIALGCLLGLGSARADMQKEKEDG